MWYNSWLETRWRMALMVLLNAVIVSLLLDDVVPAAVWLRRLDASLPMLFAMNAITLAGVGIATQISTSPGQIMHGSMLYTLSLPISRRRLVLVREAVGVVAVVALIVVTLSAVWFGASSLHEAMSLTRFTMYGLTVIATALVAYGISAVLATFLDQLWQTYAALGVTTVIFFTLPGTRIWSDLLRSAVVPDFSPWFGILSCIAIVAILSAVSVRRVQVKQF